MLKNKKQIKAIFFDLDNTLLDSAKAQTNAICEFKKFYDIFSKTDDIEFARLWDDIAEETYNRYLNKEITFEGMRTERMKKIFSYYSINITEEEAKEKFEIYLNLYEKNWILYDDIEKNLEQLKDKYKLGIISNSDANQQRKKIVYTGLNKYFSYFFISSEVGYSKPQKEIFEIACKTLKVKPENCIMIGDKYEVDIEGSINAGMQGIWINRNKKTSNYKLQIANLNELIKYIN